MDILISAELFIRVACVSTIKRAVIHPACLVHAYIGGVNVRQIEVRGHLSGVGALAAIDVIVDRAAKHLIFHVFRPLFQAKAN